MSRFDRFPSLDRGLSFDGDETELEEALPGNMGFNGSRLVMCDGGRNVFRYPGEGWFFVGL